MPWLRPEISHRYLRDVKNVKSLTYELRLLILSMVLFHFWILDWVLAWFSLAFLGRSARWVCMILGWLVGLPSLMIGITVACFQFPGAYLFWSMWLRRWRKSFWLVDEKKKFSEWWILSLHWLISNVRHINPVDFVLFAEIYLLISHVIDFSCLLNFTLTFFRTASHISSFSYPSLVFLTFGKKLSLLVLVQHSQWFNI